jgi:hypothetical protein
MVARYSAATAGAIALMARLLLVRVVGVVVHLLAWRCLPVLRVGFVEVRRRQLRVLGEKGRAESCH